MRAKLLQRRIMANTKDLSTAAAFACEHVPEQPPNLQAAVHHGGWLYTQMNERHLSVSNVQQQKIPSASPTKLWPLQSYPDLGGGAHVNAILRIGILL